MMLRTIRDKLEQQMPPFAHFYISYIMRMQDKAIEAEVRPLLRIKDVNVIGLLIDHEINNKKG